MNHSLLGANRRTHLKSAAIAVLVSLLLVTALNIGGTSRITNVPRTGQAVHGLAGGNCWGARTLLKRQAGASGPLSAQRAGTCGPASVRLAGLERG